METRACTQCGSTLVWSKSRRTWVGGHKPACPVLQSKLRRQEPSELESDAIQKLPAVLPEIGLEDVIGPVGHPLWYLTLRLTQDRGRITEHMNVRAATADGALALAHESRLFIEWATAEQRDGQNKT